MTLRRSLHIPAITLAALALSLSACSSAKDDDGGGDSDGKSGESSSFCDALTADTRTAATVFAPLIPGMDTATAVDGRLALLDTVTEPPADLADAWKTWTDYLAAVKPVIDGSPSDAFALNTDEVKAAGDELSSYYTDSCL